ncbi:MAG: Na/Pi cotransporter family protein [Bacteroidales bacterium]|nr:Na/Pi cotransporter family protein [Candidatus Equimonas enterica]
MTIYVLIKLLGSLALLMYGMKSMSEGLQKMAGSQLRHILGAMTTNRFTGILTGAFVTAAIQSSTATTVMTVSFVNAGLLTLVQAISVIMGANIGTTLTAWIMSAGMGGSGDESGFTMMTAIFLAFLIGICLIFSRRSARKSGGEFVFGLCFLLLGLQFLKQNAADMDLGSDPSVLHFFEVTGQWGFASTLLFLLLGSILTMCVQSSAAVMAITMVLCSAGALPIYQGIALVMGENIGTTVTSNIAAMTANSKSRSAALAHMVFNVFGVVWVLCIFHYFVNTVCSFVGYDAELAAVDRVYASEHAYLLNYVLPAFHTSFNVCNVLILIWFIRPLERLVSRPFPQEEEEDFRLRFIQGGILSTPELSILEAHKEINNYAERTRRMFQMVDELQGMTDDKAFNKLYSRIEKYEGISDNMEIEIANYLNNLSDGRLSSETKNQIRMMLREVSEIESIGDSCFKLAHTIHNRNRDKKVFTPELQDRIQQMMTLTNQSLEQMTKVLKGGGKTAAMVSINIETEINNYREQLKVQNVDDIAAGKYDYQTGVYYLDFVNECEKLADYVINVVEVRADVNHKG